MTDNEETSLATVAPTAIVPAPATPGLTPQSIVEAEKLAEMLAASSLVPDHFRGKPQDCFMAIAYGIELGLAPVTALISIDVIKGKPALKANTMVALVIRSGHAEYFNCVESDATHAVYETLRKRTSKARRYEFTMAQAEAAGLTAPPPRGGESMYKKYPKQMLEARAKAYLVKDVYPDVVHGIDSSEEMHGVVTERNVDVENFTPPGKSAIDVKSEEKKPEPSNEVEKPEAEKAKDDGPSLLDQILGCKTREELDGLRSALSALEGAEREKALALYAEQNKILKASAAKE